MPQSSSMFSLASSRRRCGKRHKNRACLCHGAFCAALVTLALGWTTSCVNAEDEPPEPGEKATSETTDKEQASATGSEKEEAVFALLSPTIKDKQPLPNRHHHYPSSGLEGMPNLFNHSPELAWTNVPTNAKSLVLVFRQSAPTDSNDSNDSKEGNEEAPSEEGVGRQAPRVHWVVFGIEPSSTGLPANLKPSTKEGTEVDDLKIFQSHNGFADPKNPTPNDLGYRGPTTPFHGSFDESNASYVFELYALRKVLGPSALPNYPSYNNEEEARNNYHNDLEERLRKHVIKKAVLPATSGRRSPTPKVGYESIDFESEVGATSENISSITMHFKDGEGRLLMSQRDGGLDLLPSEVATHDFEADTSLVYVYDEEGKRVASKFHDQDGDLHFEVGVDYNDSGQATTRSVFGLDGNPNRRTEFRFEEGGTKVVGVLDDTNADGTNDETTTFEHDDDLNLVKESYDSNADGEVDIVFNHIYLSNGRDTRLTFAGEPLPHNLIRERWEVGANSQITRITKTYLKKEGEEEKLHRKETQFIGNLGLTTKARWRSVRYAFSAEGVVEYQLAPNADWVMEERSDSNNNGIFEVETEFESNGLPSRIRTDDNEDKKVDRVLKIRYESSESHPDLITRTYLLDDDADGTSDRKALFTMSGSASNGFVVHDITYDTNNDSVWDAVEQFDSKGRFLLSKSNTDRDRFCNILLVGGELTANDDPTLPGTVEGPLLRTNLSNLFWLGSVEFSGAEFLDAEADAEPAQNSPTSPALWWANVPAGTGELVLLAHSESNESFHAVHWVAYGMPTFSFLLPRGVPRPAQAGEGAVIDVATPSFAIKQSHSSLGLGYHAPDSDPNKQLQFTLYALQKGRSFQAPPHHPNSELYYKSLIEALGPTSTMRKATWVQKTSSPTPPN